MLARTLATIAFLGGSIPELIRHTRCSRTHSDVGEIAGFETLLDRVRSRHKLLSGQLFIARDVPPADLRDQLLRCLWRLAIARLLAMTSCLDPNNQA